MNIGKIKEILEAPIPEAIQEKYILQVIAKDPKAIVCVLELLSIEREEKNELISDMNLLLSKAHTGLENPKYNKDGFMQNEITAFYEQGRIFHCFKNVPPKK